MWANAVQRQEMINESKNGQQFVKFVNMLMNDTTFLLDECLEYLKRIHEMQVLTLMAPAEWSKLTPEQQQTRRRQLAQDEVIWSSFRIQIMFKITFLCFANSASVGRT